MLTNPRLRQVLRSADRLLPQRARRAARVVTGRARAYRSQPLVSVVVVATGGSAAALDGCLHSLRNQHHRNLEVVVALEEAEGREARTARRHAAEDWRFHVRTSPGAGVAAGRNAGATSARGQYLAFARAEDSLPAGAVGALVASLEASGSDFAFGRLAEVGTLHQSVSTAPHPAHLEGRAAATLDTLPEAVTDVFDENRLYRTAFWRAAGLAFSDRRDRPRPALRAFAAARTFDVLADTTYHRHARGPGRPIGAVVSAMADLDEWLAEQAVMQAFLAGSDAPDMLRAWAMSVCDVEVVPLLDDVERATAAQWAALRDFLADVRVHLDGPAWQRVRAESRVKVWLALADRRAALERFVASRLFEFGNRPTGVVGGRVLARFPGLSELAQDVPEDCLVMSEQETGLEAQLRSVRWRDGERLELTVFAFPRFVDLTGATPTLHATLVETGGGTDDTRLPLHVEQYVDPEVNLVAGHRYQDYSAGAFRVVVDATRLPAPAPGGATRELALALELDAAGVTRTGRITSREERTTAGLLDHSALAPRVVGERRVGLRPVRRSGVVTVHPAPALRATECRTEGRTVTLAVAGADAGELVVTAGTAESTVRAPLQAGGVGAPATATVTVPAHPSGTAAGLSCRWSVHVEPAGSGPVPVAFPAGVEGRFAPGTTTAEVAVARTTSGDLELVEALRTLRLDELRLEAEGLRLRGTWIGVPPTGWSVTARSRRAEVSASGFPAGPDFEAVVPTTWDEWGLGRTRVPPGPYRIQVCEPGVDQGDVRVLLGPRLLDELMCSRLGPGFRMTPMRTRQGLVVRLAPPLDDDERGPFAQRRLQQWLAGPELALDDRAVYLQSYTGAACTDSQRAIHDELRRSRPDLTLYWGVASESTQVPEGGVPVLMYSREWYRVLGTATYLCNNIDFDRWFQRKPGQRFLQTFHGYPAKSMGIRLWRAKRFTPLRVGLELARTSRDWTLILTPSPEMDRYYREEYAYDGEIENAGYPRDDALLAPDADQVRERTRRLLGIGDDQVAVLYAPTWRDDQATNYRTAALTPHLDFESATALLGSRYVFLMRGHRFHTQALERSARSARLVDVTDYPEVNDLILAADAAVLDYSSMRFDFALTGRPMLFLVPDLGDYTGGVRGFLYPFEESAPGPLLQDAEEVVAALRDLPRLSAHYAEAYETFNRRFNRFQDGQAARRVVERFFR